MALTKLRDFMQAPASLTFVRTYIYSLVSIDDISFTSAFNSHGTSWIGDEICLSMLFGLNQIN